MGMHRDRALALAKEEWPSISDKTSYINTCLLNFAGIRLEMVYDVPGIVAWGYNPVTDTLCLMTEEDDDDEVAPSKAPSN